MVVFQGAGLLPRRLVQWNWDPIAVNDGDELLIIDLGNPSVRFLAHSSI
jgi:hypothetical protein